MKMTIIEAGEKRLFPDFAAAWASRSLLFAFVRRGFAVRYRQAIFGVLWAFLQPAINVAIFTIVFKHVGNLSSGGLPYPVFAAIGMTAWLYFSRSLQEASNTLVVNQEMITKIWFPRILLPLSQAVEGMIEYMIMLGFLAILCIWYGVMPGIEVCVMPLFIILMIVMSSACGLWFSALNVSFRDVRVILPFGLQAGMFASPIIWSPEALAPMMRPIVSINPMAVIIDGMRWCFGGEGTLLNGQCIAVAVASLVLISVSGAVFFASREKNFADII